MEVSSEISDNCTDLHLYDFYNQHNSQHKVMIVLECCISIYIHNSIFIRDNAQITIAASTTASYKLIMTE